MKRWRVELDYTCTWNTFSDETFPSVDELPITLLELGNALHRVSQRLLWRIRANSSSLYDRQGGRARHSWGIQLRQVHALPTH